MTIKKMIKDSNKRAFRILALLTILLIIVAVIFSINRNIEYVDKLNREYKKVEKQDNLSGTVTEIKTFKGEVNVSVENNKYWLIKSRNYSYLEIYLSEFLEVGDSIYKPIGTDTLFIYRANRECFFILGSILNRK